MMLARVALAVVVSRLAAAQPPETTMQTLGDSGKDGFGEVDVAIGPITKIIARRLQQIDQVAKAAVDGKMQWIGKTTIGFNSVAEKNSFLEKLWTKYGEEMKVARAAYSATGDIESFAKIRGAIQAGELAEATEAAEAGAACVVLLGPCVVGVTVATLATGLFVTFYADQSASNTWYQEYQGSVGTLDTDYSNFVKHLLMLPANFSFSSTSKVAQLNIVIVNLMSLIKRFTHDVDTSVHEIEKYRSSRWNVMCGVDVFGLVCDPPIPMAIVNSLKDFGDSLDDFKRSMASIEQCGMMKVPPYHCDAVLLGGFKKDATFAMQSICQDMHEVICKTQNGPVACSNAPSNCSKQHWDTFLASFPPVSSLSANTQGTETQTWSSLNQLIVYEIIMFFAFWVVIGLTVGNVHFDGWRPFSQLLGPGAALCGISIGYAMKSMTTINSADVLRDLVDQELESLKYGDCDTTTANNILQSDIMTNLISHNAMMMMAGAVPLMVLVHGLAYFYFKHKALTELTWQEALDYLDMRDT